MTGYRKDVFAMVRKQADAAVQNEAVTRTRVENLEAHAEKVGRLLTRGFWGRMRWLLRGK